MSDEPVIDYEELVQSALRLVVRETLALVALKGLPSEHHFYITFSTNHPGVDLTDNLKQQYPEEITIVLQHEFWDLEIMDGYFSVTLSFNDQAERITVPYESIISFVDPSVKFGLQFSPTYTEDGVVHEEIKPAPPKGKEPSEADSPPKDVKIPKADNVISLDTFRKK